MKQGHNDVTLMDYIDWNLPKKNLKLLWDQRIECKLGQGIFDLEL